MVSRTFSKAHALAGMRVGYLVCEPGLAAAIRSVATPFGVNLPAQSAAVAALGQTELGRTAERSAAVAAERDRVVASLRTQGWEVPEAHGNFFWLGVGEETMALAEHFRAAGILVRPSPVRACGSRSGRRRTTRGFWPPRQPGTARTESGWARRP